MTLKLFLEYVHECTNAARLDKDLLILETAIKYCSEQGSKYELRLKSLV